MTEKKTNTTRVKKINVEEVVTIETPVVENGIIELPEVQEVHEITVEPEEIAVVENKPKSTRQLAEEVIRGVHGSGRDRMNSLGSRYSDVQMEANRIMRGLK